MPQVVDASVVEAGCPQRWILSQVRKAMLRSLFDLLKFPDASRVEYLTPLLDLAGGQGSLAVATLNYDRSVEDAAQLVDFACDTGIETWLKTGELAWGQGGLRLLKLHGSIDWVVEPASEPRELPQQRIRKIAPGEEPKWESPAVVFGEAGKVRSEGPYIELLLAWSDELRHADDLLVIGYSFRDQHVNEVIARWFNADPSRRILLVDPGPLTSPRASDFARALAAVDRPWGGEQPASARFKHLGGTTAALLPQAIELAQTRPWGIGTGGVAQAS